MGRWRNWQTQRPEAPGGSLSRKKGLDSPPSKRTEEHIAKLAASNKARTGWKHTEESKAKMREAQARRKGKKDV